MDTSLLITDNFNTLINAGNTGKVGIGTFSPTEKLTVAGTIYSTSGGFKFPDGSVQTTAGVQQNSSALFSSLAVSNLAGTGDRQMIVDASGNLKQGNPAPQGFYPYWQTDGNPVLTNPTHFLGTTDASDLIFKTDANGAGGERMRITAGGNTGIGTTIPSEKLEVAGNIRINEHDILFRSVVPDGNHGLGWYGVDANFNQNKLFAGTDVNGPVLYGWNGGALGVKHGTSENILLRWDENGNVGIGTSNPQKRLHIWQTDNPSCAASLRLEFDNTIPPNGCGGPIHSTWDFNAQGDNVLTITNPLLSQPAMTFLGTGKIGIGTTTPIQTLDVNGRMNLSNGVIQKGGSAITTTSDLGLYSLMPGLYMRFVTNGAPIRFFSDGGVNPIGTNALLSIESNGNIGIGTTTPSSKLEINVTVPLDKALTVFNGANENFLVYGDGFCFARRFEVDANPFVHPDYVFKKGYPLLTIEQLKAFIDKEGHHPNFLSAKQYEKNGKYDLLEMDMNLLKTSEELTLYVIQLKKMVDEQNKVITEMKKEVEELKKK